MAKNSSSNQEIKNQTDNNQKEVVSKLSSFIKVPWYKHRRVVGLAVIFIQLSVVFVMLLSFSHTTPNSAVGTLAASEPSIDTFVENPSTVSTTTDTSQPALDPDLSTDTTSSFTANATVSTITHDPVSEDADYNHINGLRSAHGKTAYIRSACLTGIAQAWAKAYAAYGVRIHNIHLKDQIRADCTTGVDNVAENMMAQDTECHSWVVMTTLKVPASTPCGVRTAVAKVACGDTSTILDTRVANVSTCSAYPTGYPYHFKYVGVGAFKAPNGLTYIVQDFAGCDSTCRNLPPTLASGASTFPNELRLGESLARGEKISSGAGDSWYFQSTDGNAVVFAPNGNVLWATGTERKCAEHIVFQKTDGNLVIFDCYNHAIWNSQTPNKGANRVIILNDGNLVVVDPSGKALWSWKTGLIATSSCKNPFGYPNEPWTLQRMDQGVDYGPNGNLPVRVPCDGHIIHSGQPGWPPNGAGYYIHYKFDKGPLAGKCMYFAESLTPPPPDGTSFLAGQPIVTAYPGASDTEWGWSASYGTPAIQYPPGTNHDSLPPTDAGLAFDRFIASLGGINHGIGTSPTYAGNSCS